jgi:hypothetical protein
MFDISEQIEKKVDHNTEETNTAQEQDFYGLLVIDHDSREFINRVEDTPGTGKHSLAYWCRQAGYHFYKVNNGLIKGNEGHFAYDRFKWIAGKANDVNANLDQIVYCRIKATDSKSARLKTKKARQLINESYKLMGYKKIG